MAVARGLTGLRIANRSAALIDTSSHPDLNFQRHLHIPFERTPTTRCPLCASPETLGTKRRCGFILTGLVIGRCADPDTMGRRWGYGGLSCVDQHAAADPLCPALELA